VAGQGSWVTGLRIVLSFAMVGAGALVIRVRLPWRQDGA